jgi:hypothetical protein
MIGPPTVKPGSNRENSSSSYSMYSASSVIGLRRRVRGRTNVPALK